MDALYPLGHWLMIADSVAGATGTAFLAGGCLRDLENGRPMKDVDIFVPEGSSVRAITSALAQDYDSLHYTVTELSSCEGMTDVVTSVSLTLYPSETLVNIIILKGAPTMAHVLDRMDFGLCQIGHDGKDLIQTEAYLKDRRDQTLTLTRKDCEPSYARSLRRYARFAEKYQGWPLVDPFAA